MNRKVKFDQIVAGMTSKENLISPSVNNDSVDLAWKNLTVKYVFEIFKQTYQIRIQY